MAIPLGNGNKTPTSNSADPLDALKQMAAQAQSGAVGMSGFDRSGMTNPQVYWGRTVAEPEFNFITGKMEGGGVPTVSGDPVLKSAYEAAYDIYGWSASEKEAWGKRMFSNGMIADPYDWDGMVKAWSWAVDNAAAYQSQGKNITPWGFVSMYENERADAGLGLGADTGYQGPRTQTSTNTSVNLPSQSDAEATVQQLFKEQMGRDATDNELARYSSMLIGGYRDNPQTTTSTTTTTPSDFAPDGSVINSTSETTSTSTGAFNPSGMLTKKAQADPEYGAYQAATTYFNALMQAIGAPGSN